MKQSNIIGNLFIKFSAFILVSVALVYVYEDIKIYNSFAEIIINDYKISTTIGFILFIFILVISSLFYLNSIITIFLNKLYSLRKNYKETRKNRALSKLIESIIILGFGDKNGASKHLSDIDQSYLDPQQLIYLDLIKKVTSSDDIPITLYGYMESFPFVKKYISKKLAKIEFKLGNIDKSLSYAKEYLTFNNKDEENNILISDIYSSKKNWEDMDDFISDIIKNSPLLQNDYANHFSNNYYIAAQDSLSKSMISDVLHYCKSSIELNPKNYLAAALLAEVASAQKKHQFINDILSNAFKAIPNFDIFIILKKFTNLENDDLFDLICIDIDQGKYLDLFISITTLLKLDDKKQELLRQIS